MTAPTAHSELLGFAAFLVLFVLACLVLHLWSRRHPEAGRTDADTTPAATSLRFVVTAQHHEGQMRVIDAARLIDASPVTCWTTACPYLPGVPVTVRRTGERVLVCAGCKDRGVARGWFA